MRRSCSAAALAAFVLVLAASAVSAAEPQMAPGGRVDPLGASGVYECSLGRAAQVAFRLAGFVDGTYEIEERAGALTYGVKRYPWQLATATLIRERVGRDGAEKFRRLTGSLRMLQELTPGQRISADYAEVQLDASAPTLEWRYEIEVGETAASFAPSGLGEVAVAPVREVRRRYEDGQGAPLPIGDAAEGFEILETAHVAYAPDLGVALRIERRRGEELLEACSLIEFKRP